jgi:hypothetical protein
VALLITVAAAALAWSISPKQGAGRSRGWFALTALPGLLAVSAFYSLAIRMHSRLGGWPDFYGTERLPRELVAHADVSQWVFSVVLLAAVGMPLVLALFAVVPRLRSSMVYPAFCGVACWLCLFLTALAPAGFQQWWWD